MGSRCDAAALIFFTGRDLDAILAMPILSWPPDPLLRSRRNAMPILGHQILFYIQWSSCWQPRLVDYPAPPCSDNHPACAPAGDCPESSELSSEVCIAAATHALTWVASPNWFPGNDDMYITVTTPRVSLVYSDDLVFILSHPLLPGFTSSQQVYITLGRNSSPLVVPGSRYLVESTRCAVTDLQCSHTTVQIQYISTAAITTTASRVKFSKLNI